LPDDVYQEPSTISIATIDANLHHQLVAVSCLHQVTQLMNAFGYAIFTHLIANSVCMELYVASSQAYPRRIYGHV
jgi:hypothetical protein